MTEIDDKKMRTEETYVHVCSTTGGVEQNKS